MLPKILKDGILSIDGFGYSGRTEEFNWPKLARKMEELLSGGMDGPVDIDMGQEKLEMGFTLFEHSPEVLLQYGVCDVGGVLMRINGSAEADDAGCSNDAIEVIARGRWKEIDQGSFKRQDKGGMKVQASLSYFKYSVNNIPLIEIDPINNILIVGGVDRYAQRRKNLKQ